jgi:hypothetical protein
VYLETYRKLTFEKDNSDTSDGAYIARHRKYETFEKRQRRREKEKLVNEHQKLKARMEQLRSMDASAFGGKDSEESERRRRAMLATAEDLEARYRVLLPEPRHKVEKRLVYNAASESEEDPPPQNSRKLTIRISRPSASMRPLTSPSDPKSETGSRRKGRPPKSKFSSLSVDEDNQDSSYYTSSPHRLADERGDVSEKLYVNISRVKEGGQEVVISGASVDKERTRRRSRSGSELNAAEVTENRLFRAQSGESDGDPPLLLYYANSPSVMTDTNPSGKGRRTKRMRMSMQKRVELPVSYSQLAMDADSTTCALLRQATRTDATTRKTKRAHEPLGAKLGSRVEETSDYEVAMSDLLHAYRAEVQTTTA